MRGRRVGCTRGRLLMLAGVALALAAEPALAALPRSYQALRVDSPAPLAGGAFGWGITSADWTGDGNPDLAVAQAQTGPGQIFLFDGVTGQHLDTIDPPEQNPDNASQPPVLAFVYVEKMADIGSCPAGESAGDSDEICDDALIGPKDGIPEIIAGSRNLRVDVNPADGDGATRDAGDPRLGRGYVFDGATRAVLKRIDMPQADRQHQAGFTPVPAPQFARTMMSPQGTAACAGSAAEGNNLGVAPCPTPETEGATEAVRIGDVDGGGQPDIVIASRSYVESRGAAGSAAPGSQCATVTSAGTCTAGRAWIYRGEEIAGTDPQAILDNAFRTIKNPEAQLQGAEYGGNAFRIGDIGRCNAVGADGRCTSIAGQDGRPDFVIAARNMDYPFKSPDATLDDVGAAFLYDGATGGLLNTFMHPEPQPRAQFSGGFNAGTAAGDLGATALPDLMLGAPLQNVTTADDGRGYVFRGDAVRPGGGAEASWQFAQFDDPTPNVGENFSASVAGVGDVVEGAENPGNELLVGGEVFDPATQAASSALSDVHIVNGTYGRVLQTIADPDRNPGSGFGVGIAPMGDLNDDGFLDFAVSAYISDAPPGGQPGQGRVFILKSDDSPLPSSSPPPADAGAPASTPAPQVAAPRELIAGPCANDMLGSDAAEELRGTIAGDDIFGFAGDDLLQGMQSPDCLDGGDGEDLLQGGEGNDRLIGAAGDDRLEGEDGRDRLKGDAGSDRLAGGYDDDVLAGGSGRDRLDGGPGEDRIFGESGNDRIFDRLGGSAIDAGPGNDVVSVRNRRRDTVRCGRGRDRVSADRFDRIGSSCERVTLRRRRRK